FHDNVFCDLRRISVSQQHLLIPGAYVEFAVRINYLPQSYFAADEPYILSKDEHTNTSSDRYEGGKDQGKDGDNDQYGKGSRQIGSNQRLDPLVSGTQTNGIQQNLQSSLGNQGNQNVSGEIKILDTNQIRIKKDKDLEEIKGNNGIMRGIE
ncbi:MAG: hypothetical protein EZS28_006762, partial [Streblomastix strix]